MSRWPAQKLGGLAVIVMGQSPPGETYNTDGRGMPFFQGKAEFSDEYPEVQKWCDAPLKVAEPGDVLLSVRAPVGPTNIARERCCIGRGLAAIRPRTRNLTSRFLRYFFTAFESQIAQQGAGSTFDAISRSVIENLDIPLPPLSEQDRIVRILDEAEAIRRLRAQADERTSVTIPAVFAEMFLGKPSANWRKGTLAKFGVAVRYGLGQPPESDSDGVALVRATNIKRGRIVNEGLIRVDRSKVPISRNAFLRCGEVVVVRSGAYTGDIGLVDDKWEGAVAGYDMVLSPSDEMDGTFLTWLLMSKPIQEGYFAGEKARAGQPHLNAAQVEQAPAFAPPITLQRTFAAHVTEIRELEAGQAASRQRLDDLVHSLVHRAFQGEL
jgi:type I restriction enzyme S subunit